MKKGVVVVVVLGVQAVGTTSSVKEGDVSWELSPPEHAWASPNSDSEPSLATRSSGNTNTKRNTGNATLTLRSFSCNDPYGKALALGGYHP